MKTKPRSLSIIRALSLACTLPFLAAAQVPTLDPAQTVKPSTGAMGFALPLDKVYGIAGRDMPILLGYQAGIRVDQEASPVGLGFSYGVGSIQRSIVGAPDDYIDNGSADVVWDLRGAATPASWKVTWDPKFEKLALDLKTQGSRSSWSIPGTWKKPYRSGEPRPDFGDDAKYIAGKQALYPFTMKIQRTLEVRGIDLMYNCINQQETSDQVLTLPEPDPR